MHYSIEKITADNYRPGMPENGYIVRYEPHSTFGWLCRHICASLKEAKAFAKTLGPDGRKTMR